jgi:hypothetical protein
LIYIAAFLLAMMIYKHNVYSTAKREEAAMKLSFGLYTVLIFVFVVYLPLVNGMIKTAKKRVITPGRMKGTTPNAVQESKLSDNKIVPISKGSRNILYSMVKLSSRAAVAAVKATKGTLKSSVDLIAGKPWAYIP